MCLFTDLCINSIYKYHYILLKECADCKTKRLDTSNDTITYKTLRGRYMLGCYIYYKKIF